MVWLEKYDIKAIMNYLHIGKCLKTVMSPKFQQKENWYWQEWLKQLVLFNIWHIYINTTFIMYDTVLWTFHIITHVCYAYIKRWLNLCLLNSMM